VTPEYKAQFIFLIDQIQRLRKTNINDEEFKQWHQRSIRLLEDAVGDMNPITVEFKQIPFQGPIGEYGHFEDAIWNEGDQPRYEEDLSRSKTLLSEALKYLSTS